MQCLHRVVIRARWEYIVILIYIETSISGYN